MKVFNTILFSKNSEVEISRKIRIALGQIESHSDFAEYNLFFRISII